MCDREATERGISLETHATHLIVQQLGIDYLQRTFEKMGLQDTEVHEQGFRLTPRRIVDDNRTSPRDMAYILEKIYKKEMVSPEASAAILMCGPFHGTALGWTVGVPSTGARVQ